MSRLTNKAKRQRKTLQTAWDSKKISMDASGNDMDQDDTVEAADDDNNEDEDDDNDEGFKVSVMRAEMAEERAALFEKAYWNERKKWKRAKKSLQTVKERMAEAKAEWEEEKKIQKKSQREAEQEILRLMKKLEKADKKTSSLQGDKENLKTKSHTLEMRVSRAGIQKDCAVVKAVKKTKTEINNFDIKQKGIVTNTAHDLTRNLVKVGVKPSIFGEVVEKVCKAAGVEVKGSILHTTAHQGSYQRQSCHRSSNCGCDEELGSDHAEDQKKLASLIEALKCAWEHAGGPKVWATLSDEEHFEQNEDAYCAICRWLGQERFDALTEMEQHTIDLFVWTGCEIHKDHNTIQYSCKAMTSWWKDNKIEGPVKLMNKTNVEAARIGGAAGKNAAKVSVSGAIKLTSLAVRPSQLVPYLYEKKLGYLITFPDTSNNRFQTHAQAAETIILHLDLLKEFLLFICNKKANCTWTNLELNLWNGLNDLKTIHKLAVLAVYSQSVSVPYVEFIRSDPNLNALDLGPFHDSVVAHCKSIINNPNLLLGPDVLHKPATLKGERFQCPEVMYAVHRLTPTLPHLSPLVQAFFMGASEGWPRFMTKFAKASGLNPAEHRQAHQNTTNDLNESAFGIAHCNWRFVGNTSLLYHNAHVQLRMHEGLDEFIQSMDQKGQQFLRVEARERMAAGDEKESCRLQDKHNSEAVEKKRKRDAEVKEKEDSHRQILSSLDVIVNPGLIPPKITVVQIDLQLDWHHMFSPSCNLVPIKSKCGKHCAERLDTLWEAIQQFLESGKSVSECKESTVPPQKCRRCIKEAAVEVAVDDEGDDDEFEGC
ncbi:hypothetical protein BT96DRAFT_945402 [Gymnopus androsaceus JB14]|uniref:Uncharacterized protein n=1 Tax=Gymnopus androsaceus JB14 TaxID=1447944 RepID=A0A6A4H117_9AGAR|nr:hypothetical protein BT96DRAFT_945402 [Gymnopus androsaceus JB14]